MPHPLEHRTTKTVTKGTPHPLGATPPLAGVNFALYSQHATEVFLLLFDEADGDPDNIRLEERDRFVWHALVEGITAGQLNGYKVRGEYRPEWGLRFNDARLLLDPYAKAVTGKFRNADNLLLAYDPQPGAGESVQDRRDNTAIVPGASSSTTGSTGRGRHLSISSSNSSSSTRSTSRAYRDGSDDNHSWNCGVEGVTGERAIVALRKQLMKNFACYLLFSSGTPMILGGDEFARTQQGNNNAYCQDNEIGWFDWTAAASNQDLTEFFRKAIALTRRFPVRQRRKFYLGHDLDDDGVADLTWYSNALGTPPWQDANARMVCVQLDASEDGTNNGVDRLFFILNGHYEPQWITLPQLGADRGWHRAIDTSLPGGEDFLEPRQEVELDPADHYIVNPRSTVVLFAQQPKAGTPAATRNAGLIVHA